MSIIHCQWCAETLNKQEITPSIVLIHSLLFFVTKSNIKALLKEQNSTMYAAMNTMVSMKNSIKEDKKVVKFSSTRKEQLKCKWNVFFYCWIWKSSKIGKMGLPFLNISSNSRVIKVKEEQFHNKKRPKSCQNQSKSTKFVTSCAGHVDGMKKWTGNNSPITGQSQVKLFRQEVDGNFQLLMSKK